MAKLPTALAATEVASLQIGAVLAERYEIRGLLGEGGMGKVFCAWDRELDEEVALKVLRVEAGDDAAALKRFRREVKLARRVTHRNVARTYDLGVDGRLRFLTMELIAGESLAAWRGTEKMPLPEALRIAAGIARGLAAAHGVGVVHRDLKPENVMLAEDRVVITDFGIARVAEGGKEVLRTGMVVGTPAYMAPEQIENGAVDGRTDVYALGTMLFELLTGELPFQADSAVALAAQRLREAAPSVRSVDTVFPDALASLVDAMLARRREERPDAQTVLDRIEALRGNAGRAGQAAPRLPSVSEDSLVLASRRRTVAVEELKTDEAGTSLARMLHAAIEGGLTEARVAEVVLRGTDADLVVQGSVHASKERLRARLRLVDTRRAVPTWAGHVDGSMADTLDLEDRVVHAALEAVRATTSENRGPTDPELNAAWTKARAALGRFTLPELRSGMALLEQVEQDQPGDPFIRGLLARLTYAAWSQMGARDRSMGSRAEELALRALGRDPTVSDALHVVALIRFMSGEYPAFLRAESECLRQAPLFAEAHQILGQLLCESLQIEEGRRRLDLAARLEPEHLITTFHRSRVAALLGEREHAWDLLDKAKERTGPLSTAVADSRLAIWFHDRERAARVGEVVAKAQAGAAWDGIAKLMKAFVEHALPRESIPLLEATPTPDAAPRHRCLMYQIGAEMYAVLDEREHALVRVEAFAQLPSTDLLWMDRCQALANIRAEPRFADARAAVAARVAELWG